MSSCLVVAPSWVGDMVMAQSLFMQLKAQDPALELQVLAPAWSLPLLLRMPEVAAGIEMPLGHGQVGLGARYRLGRELRKHRFDRVIVLPNSFKSALVPWWAHIPVRTGYRGEARWGLLNDIRQLDKQALPMTVQRFVALAGAPGEALPDPLPQPRLHIEAAQVASARETFSLREADSPVLALCPGAEYGPAKRWPVEYFVEVARAQIEKGWQVWTFGSEADRPWGERICAAVGDRCTNLAGLTSLAQAVDLMSVADHVVSNDSGLMHVAAALDRRLVALYGSSDPGFTPPLHPRAEVLTLGLECSPCFKRECPLGHLKCLKDLHPDQVREVLDRDHGDRRA